MSAALLQIAALSKAADAQAETAKKTIEIQTKLAADRLALIEKNEKAVTDAIKKATQEQAQLRVASADEQKKIDAAREVIEWSKQESPKE